MRRRLTLTIVSVVALALVLTGLGTLVLARRAAQEDTERELLRQASAVAQAADDIARPAAIAALRQALRLENATLARLQPRTGTWADLPAGISDADLGPVATGGRASGHHGSLVFAAAPTPSPRGRVAVVLTRQLPRPGAGVGYFLLAGALALVIAAVVGDRLGRRIAKPLVEAEDATRRIATGDLDVRVAESPKNDPELVSLAASINSMAENLARLRGLERQFLLSVSHDLRTPLTSIRGFAEAIADGATDDDIRAATVIVAEARRLERLVGDLLDLARLDGRQFALTISDVDVGEVVEDASDGFRPAAREAGLEIVVSRDQGSLIAPADPERLAQVVANLVENVLNFAAGRVDVDVQRGAHEVIVSVSDDGPGIAPAEQSRVFDRLYQPPRAGGAQPRRAGSGLGLAIVAELVSAMGGSVRATTAPSGGTRVTVSLRAASSSNATSV